MENLLNNNKTQGEVAQAIAKEITKLPSDLFIWAALGSFGFSYLLKMTGKREESSLFEKCAASFFVVGLCNKMIQTDEVNNLSLDIN